MGSIKELFDKLNYVHKVEMLVIFAIVVMVLYVAYSLDLFKKDK